MITITIIVLGFIGFLVMGTIGIPAGIAAITMTIVTVAIVSVYNGALS